MAREDEIRARVEAWEREEFVTWNSGPFVIDIRYLLKENQRLQRVVDEEIAQEIGFQERGGWDRMNELEQERQRLRETLEHIREYWNRDENEGAMSDALWHIIEECDQALQPKEDVK